MWCLLGRPTESIAGKEDCNRELTHAIEKISWIKLGDILGGGQHC